MKVLDKKTINDKLGSFGMFRRKERNLIIFILYVIAVSASCQSNSTKEKELESKNAIGKRLVLISKDQESGHYDQKTKTYVTTSESHHFNKLEFNDSMTILTQTANPPAGGEFVYTWILDGKKQLNGQDIYNAKSSKGSNYLMVVDSKRTFIKIVSDGKIIDGIISGGFFMQFNISNIVSK